MIRLPSRIALLVLAAMLTSGTAHAQARGPTADEVLKNGQPIGVLDEAGRAKKLAELKHWLASLPGRYSFDGVLGVLVGAGTTIRVSGVVDCVSIGEGPGVHCVLNATWPKRGEEYLQPYMMLFGLSPDNLQIQVLEVDGVSLARGWYGRLTSDDTVVLDRLWNPGCFTPIVIQFYQSFCAPEETITARSENKFITMEQTFLKVFGSKLELKREPPSKKDSDSKTH